jgi:hypothetical protein
MDDGFKKKIRFGGGVVVGIFVPNDVSPFSYLGTVSTYLTVYRRTEWKFGN